MASLVRLLRAHSALKQRRFSAAVEAFEEAGLPASFRRTDHLGLAAALRGVGDHAAAIQALAQEDCFLHDQEFIYWKAISSMALGHEGEASALLSTIAPLTRDARTSWLAAYLSSALNCQNIDPPSALSERYSGITGGDTAEVVFALLDYKSPDLAATSSNIGDYIQTLSLMRQLSRFLSPKWSFADPGLFRVVNELSATWTPEERREVSSHVHITTLDRDVTWPVRTLYPNRRVWCILHGWYHQWSFGFGTPFPPPETLRVFVLSFHLHDYHSLDRYTCEFLRQHQPIGCRDWSTTDWLLNAGVDAFFSGCLTSTLSFASGAQPSHDLLYVDAVPPPGVYSPEQITHERDQIRHATFRDNIEEALRLLNLYSCSAHVTTSRLHCYLPCRALGTPVTFRPRNPGNRRFDGLSDLDDSGLDVMQGRIRKLLDHILPSVLSGEDEDDTRANWARITHPWVAEARHRLAMAPRLFSDFTDRGVEAKQPVRVARKSELTVVLAFDRGYVRHVPPLMRSIREGTSEPVHYVFLARGLDADDFEELLCIAERRVQTIPMDAYLTNTLVRLSGATSISTMDRLFLPQLLPHHDRVVYLDIDAVCLGDLAELVAYEPGPRGIAARPNPAPQLRVQADIVEHCARSVDATAARRLRREAAADVTLGRHCLNAGVLVLSLARLRTLGFTETALRLVQDFGLQDEQTLNIFSQGDFNELASNWNAMPYFDACGRANLIHWAGPNKPWLARPVRFTELWQRFGGERNAAEDPESAGYWGNREHYSTSWEERNRVAAGLISSGSNVLDLGCGRMSLRRFLPSGCRYFPADLPRWSTEVIPVDLEAGEFPAGLYDYVVILGVLEHLTNPAAVIAAAADHTAKLIASYNHPGPQSTLSRRRNALWINDFSEDDLRIVFRAAGWAVRSLHVCKSTPNEREVIYFLER